MELLREILLMVVLTSGVVAWSRKRLCPASNFGSSAVSLVAGTAALRFAGAICSIRWGIEEAKGADPIAAEIWEEVMGGSFGALQSHPNFLMQVAWDAPGFIIGGATLTSGAMMNVLAMTVGAIEVGAAVGRMAGSRAGIFALVLMLYLPAVLYWGLHSLRDPMIFLGASLLTSSAIQATTRAPWLTSALIASLLIGNLRAELLVALAPLPILAKVSAPRPGVRSRGTNVSCLLVVLVGIGLLVPWALQEHLHIPRFSVEEIEAAAGARFERSQRDIGRGDSSWDSAEAFGGTGSFGPWVLRSVGILLAPFPLAPRATQDWIVAIDSAILAGMCFTGLIGRGSRNNPGRGVLRLSRLLVLGVFAGCVGYGLVVANVGNAFRVRLALVPLAVAAAAIHFRRAPSSITSAKRDPQKWTARQTSTSP
jgi:hypothetical protein